jgi:hypothetical protein
VWEADSESGRFEMLGGEKSRSLTD